MESSSFNETPLLATLKNTVQYKNGRVFLLNRREYPEKIKYVECKNYEEVAVAIENMTIQGSVTMALTAGYGFVLALEHYHPQKNGPIGQYIRDIYNRFLHTRPTGQQLKQILDKCLGLTQKAMDNGTTSGEELAQLILSLMDDERAAVDLIAQRCGENMASLIEDGDKILTHCFAGSALIHMLLAAKKADKHIEMYCTETRPYLQGARLAASSIRDTGTKVTLVTDNMPGFLMEQGMVTKMVTAMDKITLDGYVCNKIGTYQYAVVAHQHNIPYYVFGYAGPDKDSPTREFIKIEYRDPEEIFYCRGVRTAAKGIGGLYPSFDIIPPKYVDAIVTHRGIYPPQNIKAALE